MVLVLTRETRRHTVHLAWDHRDQRLGLKRPSAPAPQFRGNADQSGRRDDVTVDAVSRFFYMIIHFESHWSCDLFPIHPWIQQLDRSVFFSGFWALAARQTDDVVEGLISAACHITAMSHLQKGPLPWSCFPSALKIGLQKEASALRLFG